jgi:hypothetical protein
MICLFADLSLMSLLSLFALDRGTRRQFFALHLNPHRIPLRGVGPHRISARMFERFAIPYRDCNSNPKGRGLNPRRCQPLVTRIIPIQKFDAPNR